MASPFVRAQHSRYTGQATAGSTSKENVFRSPVAGTFLGAIVPDTVLTGAATNNRVVRFVNLGQTGGGSTVMATLTFANGTNAPAGDETTITVLAGNDGVAVGDIIALDTTV